MDSQQLFTLTVTLAAILVAGLIACLPLYHWNIARFRSSSLYIKCIMWVPIYLVWLVAAYSQPLVTTTIVAVVVIIGIIEFRHATRRVSSIPSLLYIVGFCYVGGLIAAAAWLSDSYVYFVMAICVSSAISDVVAFFCGNFIGRHPLPRSINNRKSWEGVVGQLAGGVLGMLLFIFIVGGYFTWYDGLIVGVASAIGDIANSIAKRTLGIKDWGRTIPGHGGMLDRCSSLFMALFVMLLYRIIFSS